MRVWLTYAWGDNEASDVDFVVQELEASGVEVRLDRNSIVPGQRLWEQIAQEIEDENCHGWIIYATGRAFEREAIREELGYAIDRTLNSRGDRFPLIALLADAEAAELPASLRIRLAVPLSDPEWIGRVKAGLEAVPPAHNPPVIDPFAVTIHDRPNGAKCLEVRPRAGTWSPVFFAVPEDEYHRVGIALCGPRDLPTGTGVVSSARISSDDGASMGSRLNDEATPSRSLYVFFDALPSRVRFGSLRGPQYEVSIP